MIQENGLEFLHLKKMLYRTKKIPVRLAPNINVMKMRLFRSLTFDGTCFFKLAI